MCVFAHFCFPSTGGSSVSHSSSPSPVFSHTLTFPARKIHQVCYRCLKLYHHSCSSWWNTWRLCLSLSCFIVSFSLRNSPVFHLSVSSSCSLTFVRPKSPPLLSSPFRHNRRLGAAAAAIHRDCGDLHHSNVSGFWGRVTSPTATSALMWSSSWCKRGGNQNFGHTSRYLGI